MVLVSVRSVLSLAGEEDCLAELVADLAREAPVRELLRLVQLKEDSSEDLMVNMELLP